MGYYSCVPQPEDIARLDWDGPRRLAEIELKTEEQLRYLEGDLEPYVREFHPARDRAQAGGRSFYLNNGSYECVDAELLYATIRRWRPSRLLELGFGCSSLVAAEAAKRNACDGHSTSVTAVDPYPREEIVGAVDGCIELRRISATDVELDTFTQLMANDILFVDTTHAVKPAGKVNFIVLEVLPVLSPGVLVHFHDVFLPWEYPREWICHEYYWTEQDLLQAFLCGNAGWEILLAAHHTARPAPNRLSRAVPTFVPFESRARRLLVAKGLVTGQAQRRALIA